MAGTSKADDDGSLTTSFGSSAKNDMTDINAKVEDNESDDVVHKALNDDIQDESNKGMDIKILV